MQATSTIKHGLSRRYGPRVLTNRYPTGWQAVVRQGTECDEVLVVAHRFEDEPEEIVCPLPHDGWNFVGSLACRPSGLAA